MEYFAGANTVKGFVSLFDEVFSKSKRLYILKGSSGCGKSTLMRRVAGKAQKSGLEPHRIYCSGDPDSLDGVIIPELGIAVADGTAPHTMDTKYPGVRETIINLGEFWDENALMPHRDEIIALTDKKSGHYKKAYKILNSYGEAREIKRQLITQCTDKPLLEKYAFKMAEKFIAQQGEKDMIFASAFTFDGIKTLPVFGEAEATYRVIGRCSDQFLTALEQICLERGGRITVACHPLDKDRTESIYFHGSGILVASSAVLPCTHTKFEKTISSSRFAHKDCIQAVRSRINGLDKLMKELSLEAQKELALARETHAEIEKIYISTMDFARMDEFTFALLDKIFGE